MNPTTTPSDMLYGADAIGEFLGMRVNQVRHRARAGDIPTFKTGRIVCASRASLNAWLAERAAAAREPRR